MRNFTRLYPVALALVLALWLILGFWPLGGGSRIFLSIAALLLAGGLGGYLWRQSGAMAGSSDERMLPPEHFEGAVVLACGDSEAVFASDCLYRETRQGWYIPVREPEQLGPIAESLFSSRPALAGQVSVMLAIVPERWQDASRFASQLHQWQRAIAQSAVPFPPFPPSGDASGSIPRKMTRCRPAAGISSMAVTKVSRCRKRIPSPDRI